MKEIEFKSLVGKTIVKITGLENGSESVEFKTSDGLSFKMFHNQDCCEHVSIDDVCGDVSDLIGNEILQSEENTSNQNPEGVNPEYQDSFTWTFYRISTMRGQVVIRWYGESNGYYSESVNFEISE